ncbi:SusC/RagA family TonB-linked outer membrane protein [Algibacter lectus]|uniref:TonB-linked SusC/RagA family outer membrane protein n=1 Tax=Algibacter lectus TaxID=221126 RepID=A0A4R8MA50_9FLAO|nr:TonB-dependent receptor [Algibacter lectus]MWW25687.1 SusC/RagA family TonB-linked outer membrane protein [Algibacter lectus]TDY60967.1 TonB-linked SusC/RagA family outer membrane protein [Algibacter lectus]
MKIKLHNFAFYRKKRHLGFFLSVLAFSCVSASFGLAPNTSVDFKVTRSYLQQQITGTITDINGQPVPGVNIREKGTGNGAQSDFDGGFAITPSKENAVLVFSFVGFKTQEVTVTNQKVLKITLEEDIAALDEVVVVGYGTRTKTTVTSAVSQIDSETFENRAIASVSNGLQGAVPGLQITNSSSGGEPGAAQNINIRGLMTSTGTGISNAGPLVLVDGAVMDMNDINPEDIQTVTVLKDAAAASIYGSRAAGGAILITTKSGKDMNGGMKVNYSNNFSFSTFTQWPDQTDALTYVTVMNEAGFNNTGRNNVFFSEDAIDRIEQNIANPGSAPTLVTKNNGLDWDVSSGGLYGSGNTDWKEFLFSDFAVKTKHNLSFRGGDEKLNYYISAGAYSEDGLFKVAENTFDRYNLDAKIAAKPTKWLAFELLTKMQRSDAVFPWDPAYGRGRVFDQLSKLKPTMPTVDPIYGEPLPGAYYPSWQHSSEVNTKNQLVLLPRVTIEPIKDWRINLEYNYRTNNNKTLYSTSQYEATRPNGDTQVIISSDQTRVTPTLATNDYWSPNIYTSYNKTLGGHHFDATVGYQSERYNVYNISANAYGLLSDNVTAISTAVGDQTVTDNISHWSTESMFGRFGYNYKGKYIARVTYRRDGSSRFEPGNRWAGFPSFELGYNVAKENFWPIEEISMFKLRASNGSLGNQNVGNYLYVPRIPVANGFYLFNGEREYTANVPNLTSINLTWETVKTKDIGIDILALNNKLGFSFDWYRSDIENMSTNGTSLPAVLGTSSPLVNGGISRTQGWEAEVNWQQTLGDFKYNIRATLSDYKQTIVSFPNETQLLSDFYTGRDLGEVWGLQWEGWFASDQEALDRESVVNQRWVHNSQFGEGDTKYVDVNGDGVINNGNGTVEDHGDYTVIANTTPRYQYGLTLGASYKGFDFNAFIQGVGKRDIAPLTGSLKKQFLGPNQGPFHSNVYAEHLDYYRPADTDSPLGANTDSYFARPYAVNNGKNNRNYSKQVDRYIQNGAYARLKTIQLGYTIPSEVTDKYKIDRFRIFITGENLLTVSDLLFYDPESVAGQFSGGSSYPLSKTFSLGVNLSF